MRIKQAVIPAILALSAAASILLGSAVSASASSTAGVRVVHSHMYMHDVAHSHMYMHD
jgi:hypothetical protein